jgi:hypothetical protein
MWPVVDVAGTRVALAGLRPDLVGAFDAAVPGARAAVLRRLWAALRGEPLPQVRAVAGDVVWLVDGRSVTGDGAAVVVVQGRPVTDPGVVARELGLGSGFAAELDGSVANLALARAAAGPAPSLAELVAAGPVAGLARAEQAVVDGHPTHPCCRTRSGMSTADVLAYGPEHRVSVRPVLLGVPARRWWGAAPPVLVAHPWQAGRLREAYPFLTVAGDGPVCRPLMSLRTLAPVEGGAHLKTAVDVQMTSAVRTVSAAALRNGPVLSGLLRELTAGLPVQVLAESAGGAVLDGAGRPDRRAAFLRRAAPRVAAGEVVLPLAAAQVVTGVDVRRWAAALGRLVPAVAEVARRGVALEAHGQNLLVVVRDGVPVRLVYRDLGGVRVHRRLLGERLPPLVGDVVTGDDDEFAATVSASLGGALQAWVGARPAAERAGLWALLGGSAPRVRKATTAMRLAADPLAPIWVAA